MNNDGIAPEQLRPTFFHNGRAMLSILRSDLSPHGADLSMAKSFPDPRGASDMRFRPLDLWKGIAALGVALFQSPSSSALAMLWTVKHFWRVVYFFFVLSGFVVSHAMRASSGAAAPRGAGAAGRSFERSRRCRRTCLRNLYSPQFPFRSPIFGARSDPFRVPSARTNAARQPLALRVRRRLERAELNHIGENDRLSYSIYLTRS